MICETLVGCHCKIDKLGNTLLFLLSFAFISWNKIKYVSLTGVTGIWSLKSDHSCSQYKGNYLHKDVMLCFVGCDLLTYLPPSMTLYSTWPSKLPRHCHLQFKSSTTSLLSPTLSTSCHLFIVSSLSLSSDSVTPSLLPPVISKGIMHQ